MLGPKQQGSLVTHGAQQGTRQQQGSQQGLHAADARACSVLLSQQRRATQYCTETAHTHPTTPNATLRSGCRHCTVVQRVPCQKHTTYLHSPTPTTTTGCWARSPRADALPPPRPADKHDNSFAHASDTHADLGRHAPLRGCSMAAHSTPAQTSRQPLPATCGTATPGPITPAAASRVPLPPRGSPRAAAGRERHLQPCCSS